MNELMEIQAEYKDDLVPLIPPHLISEYKKGPSASFLIRSVYVLGNAAGVALACLDPQRESVYNIVHLWVAERYRGQGIGCLLLTEMEESVRQRQGKTLQIFFKKKRNEGETPIQRLLKQKDWSLPYFQEYIVRVSGEHVLELPWMKKPLPNGYSHFHWKDPTPEDRAALEKWEEEEAGAWRILNPLGLEYDPDTSLGIHHQQQLVGWILTQRLTPSSFTVRQFYIIPDHRGQGIFLSVLGESIRRMIALGGKDCLFTVGNANPRMLSFALRMLKGHLLYIKEKYYCFKNLVPS